MKEADEVKRLADFLLKEYDHEIGNTENHDGESAVDMAIRLLTKTGRDDEIEDYVRGHARSEKEIMDYMKSELSLISARYTIRNYETDINRLEAKVDLLIDLLYISLGGDPKELG